MAVAEAGAAEHITFTVVAADDLRAAEIGVVEGVSTINKPNPYS